MSWDSTQTARMSGAPGTPGIAFRCVLSARTAPGNRMTYLIDFGESGNNFIEIGKESQGPKKYA